MDATLTIIATRDAYDRRDIKTLTVGELTRILEGYDEDTPVLISNDNGYTYGAIRYASITLLSDEEID